MPNRILKESICRSDSIDSLSWFEEVLFYRLIVVCDDYGRFDGRIPIIKGTCFPLKDIRTGEIEKALSKLSAVGMVEMYEVQGRPYLQLTAWRNHQQIRARKSKFPGKDNNCNQLISNVPVIQSESNTNTDRDIPPTPLTQVREFLEAYPVHVRNTNPAETEYCRVLRNDCHLTEQDLVDAARHYAEAMAILEREERYVKRPENFLRDNFFVDYLPGNYKRPQKSKKKHNANKGIEKADYGDLSALEKELIANG